MSFINEFVSFFENLARQHVHILHQDEEKHFFRLEIEEYLSSIPSSVNFPAFVLEGFDLSFFDRETNSILKNVNCAFAVLKHLEHEQDVDAIHQIWDECENIGLDILVRIYNEKFTRLGLIYKLDFNTVIANLVANDAGRSYGVRFTFTLMVRQSHIIDKSKWLDLT
jgi:hypothetical protein